MTTRILVLTLLCSTLVACSAETQDRDETLKTDFGTTVLRDTRGWTQIEVSNENLEVKTLEGETFTISDPVNAASQCPSNASGFIPVSTSFDINLSLVADVELSKPTRVCIPVWDLDVEIFPGTVVSVTIEENRHGLKPGQTVCGTCLGPDGALSSDTTIGFVGVQ